MSIFDGLNQEIEGLGVSFPAVTGGSTQDVNVYLTPEEVHETLVAATRAVVRPGAEPRVEENKTVHRQTDARGTWATTTVNVRVFENMRQMVGEICELAGNPPNAPRYYQFGEWFLELQTGNGYYIETFGHSARVAFGDWSTENKRFELGSNYSAMMANGDFQPALATEFARKWQIGKPLQGVNAGTANVLVAMLLSEALRNYRTYLVNLMCLDLIDWKVAKWSELPDKYHPMARGGTYQRGVTGLSGGEKDPTTRLYEKILCMNWLCNREVTEDVYIYRYNNALNPLDTSHPSLKTQAQAKIRWRMTARGYKVAKMAKKS